MSALRVVIRTCHNEISLVCIPLRPGHGNNMFFMYGYIDCCQNDKAIALLEAMRQRYINKQNIRCHGMRNSRGGQNPPATETAPQATGLQKREAMGSWSAASRPRKTALGANRFTSGADESASRPSFARTGCKKGGNGDAAEAQG